MSAPALRIVCTFQSTLSMRRATGSRPSEVPNQSISIHALHEESDPPAGFTASSKMRISIHALHEESDLRSRRFCAVASCDFNPRSP